MNPVEKGGGFSPLCQMNLVEKCGGLFIVPDESGTNDRMNPVLPQGLDSSRAFGMTVWRWFEW
jgi:hypothetical protein